MSNLFLFDTPILPRGFVFPQSYLDIVKADSLVDIEPWSFLCEDMATSLSYYGWFLIRNRQHPVIPFAMINDETGLYNDGYVVFACFDGSDTSGDPKVGFYDSSSSHKNLVWDKQYYVKNFSVWLESAKKESIDYKAMREEAMREE